MNLACGHECPRHEALAIRDRAAFLHGSFPMALDPGAIPAEQTGLRSPSGFEN
jgi:hypothetical protein